VANETSSAGASGHPRLKLYQFAASGNSRIVRLVLEEKGLPFERINIDVTKGENRTPEFLKLNPRGKVPVLIHSTPEGDVLLSESSVINEYLEEVFPQPPLMPAAPAKRAHVREMVYLFDTQLSPTTGLLIIEKLLKKPEEQRADGPEDEGQRQGHGNGRLGDVEVGGDGRQGDHHQEEVEGVQGPAEEPGRNRVGRLARRHEDGVRYARGRRRAAAGAVFHEPYFFSTT